VIAEQSEPFTSRRARGLYEQARAFSQAYSCDRPPAGLAADMIKLRQAIDLLELKFSEMAAELVETDTYQHWGSATAIDWIRHECKMGGGAAADRVDVGRCLDKLPCSAEALSAGEIGFGHLALIARTATALSNSPTSTGFDEARLTEQRSLYLNPQEDGMVTLSGILDPEGGALLRTALEPLAKRFGTDDERHRERRLADALVELAHHSLEAGLVPQRASQRSHLQVTTTLETLLQQAGAPAADLEFSLPISAKTVERLACDCTVTRILLGADSAVIDVGRGRRVISGPMRKALNVRDRGCAWPGCDRPASWTSGHHLVHWIHGGPTSLDNTALLRYHHHVLVHEGDWQLIRTDDGRMLTIPRTAEYSHLARGPDG
jgi:hypothetical protein